MSERISGAEVREWAEFLGRADSLRILADQMEADAAELARLAPLAAEWEAVLRVLAHPDLASWKITDPSRGPVSCMVYNTPHRPDARAPGVGVPVVEITAPTMAELADNLDALAAARVPEPEEWCVVIRPAYFTSVAQMNFTCREDAMAAARGHPAYQRRTAAQVVRHPDGSFTVIPEKGE